MDKTIDQRLETADYKPQSNNDRHREESRRGDVAISLYGNKIASPAARNDIIKVNFILGVIFAFMMLFCSTVSYAATQTSDNAEGTSSELSVVLSRAIEAGKAVSKRALSSKPKETGGEVSPVVNGTSGTAGKAAATVAGVTAKTPATKVAATPGQKNKVKKSWEEKLPAPDPAEEKLKGEEKTYQGVVAGAGFNGIAVGGQNGAPGEMWFDYVKGLKLSGVAKLAELQMGDTVKVFYKETKERRRYLKGITLIRKAPIVPEAPAEKVQEEDEE